MVELGSFSCFGALPVTPLGAKAIFSLLDILVL